MTQRHGGQENHSPPSVPFFSILNSRCSKQFYSERQRKSPSNSCMSWYYLGWNVLTEKLFLAKHDCPAPNLRHGNLIILRGKARLNAEHGLCLLMPLSLWECLSSLYVPIWDDFTPTDLWVLGAGEFTTQWWPSSLRFPKARRPE